MRREQHADWLVEGAMRSAGIGFRENPNEPIGQTSFTYNRLRGRIRTRLETSGVKLNKRSLASATYWLVNRVANMIGNDDKDITVEGYIDKYTSQYLRDKDMSDLTGEPMNRGPIHSRKWWETYYTPENLQQTLEDRRKRRERGKTAPEKEERQGKAGVGKTRILAMDSTKTVYVAIDGDDIGSLVEETLLSDDPEKARAISQTIHKAHERIEKLLKDVGGKMIFDGGDNMLMHMSFDPETIEEFRNIYVDETGHTATVGVGERPIHAHFSLVVGKNTGKDKTVVYSDEVAQQAEEIKKHQEALEPLSKQLKYRAGADAAINSGEKIKGAMWELQMNVTDEAVYDLLYRLIERFGLDDIELIANFFNQEREILKERVREVYAKRKDWAIRIAGRQLTPAETDGMIKDMTKIIASASFVREKVRPLIEILSRLDPHLVAAADGLKREGDRLVIAALEMGSEIEGGRPMESVYVHELCGKSVEAAALTLPIDQAIMAAFCALDNAQVEHLDEIPEMPIDTRSLIEKICALTGIIGHSAMLVEMAVISSKSNYVMLVAGDNPTIMREKHMPGHTNVPSGKGQKSPHKRHDWLNTEDYNKDQVDYSKTDWYFVGGNHTKDQEEMTFGGDPGPAIYVP